MSGGRPRKDGRVLNYTPATDCDPFEHVNVVASSWWALGDGDSDARVASTLTCDEQGCMHLSLFITPRPGDLLASLIIRDFGLDLRTTTELDMEERRGEFRGYSQRITGEQTQHGKNEQE